MSAPAPFRLSLVLACAAVCLAATTEPTTIDAPICQPTGNCTCSPYGEYGQVQVDCSGRKLLAFPTNAHLPPKTDFLDLKMNEIHKLDKLEKNDDIKHLSLSINDLTEIDHFAFEQTKNLIYLDLSFNQLKTIPETLFDGLDTLQFLNLSNNHLEYLPQDIFKKCLTLFELRLSHNPLKSINSETFFYLSQLEVLDLSFNEIYSLESTTFRRLNKLDTLDLSGNDLGLVPINALRNAPSLTSLDLSKNPIKIVDEDSFHKLYSLKELTMDHMKQLVEIKKKAFSHLFNLQILSLQDNPHLSYIDKFAFVGAFNHSWIALRDVKLRRNALSTLSEGTLPFCNLTSLDLTENPWKCDCHLHWIKYCEELKKNFQRGILCTSPDRLRGHNLDSVEHKQLVCEGGSAMQQSSVLFSVSLFFMFLMFATLVIFIYRDRFYGFYGNNRKQGSIYYVRAQSETE